MFMWSVVQVVIWTIGVTTIYGWLMPAFMGGGKK